MESIPVITTDRLVMRAPCAEDIPAFSAFYASPDSRFVGGPMEDYQTWRYTAEVLGHWALRGYGRWMVERKSTPGAIGLVGLHAPQDWPEPEIGWLLWDGKGMGFAGEAACATRAFAYETVGLKTVISSIDPKNTASIRLAERMGAVREAQDFVHPKHGRIGVWRHLSSGHLS